MSNIKFSSLFVLFFLLAQAAHCQPAWQWAAAGPVDTTGFPPFAWHASDAAGNLVVAGYFSGRMTLGSYTLQGAGQSNLFVARLSATGQWTQAIEVAGASHTDFYGLAVALDSNGDAIVGGSFASASITLGSFTLPNARAGQLDGFVARLSAAGQWVQAVRVGGSSNDEVVAVALEPNGTCVVAGNFGGAGIQLGSTSFTNRSPGGAGSDIFVAWLDRAGQWTQAVAAGGHDSDQVRALARRSTGELAIGGSFLGYDISFGNQTVRNVSAGHTDIFVARLTSTGQWTQATAAGGFFDEGLSTVSFDGNGQVVATGNFASSTCNFGSTTLLSSTGRTFVARLAAGQWTQAQSINGLGIGAAQAAGNGDVLVAGPLASLR
ncbi:hypothetical protein Q5H93_10795 [Hymenobacter sp. ASUV-10]|uniref:Uncharacterized protein n=1 Tax=Hymenobacter aranciens TaxID=3063996 RepID=A0ABT9BAC7_9BACT|nr:hypothetical protein [Hymenobacter sp. ASUV-10]MDO7875220.1 hypothetical protein [Hymenobacter sp. ASUV-10]